MSHNILEKKVPSFIAQSVPLSTQTAYNSPHPALIYPHTAPTQVPDYVMNAPAYVKNPPAYVATSPVTSSKTKFNKIVNQINPQNAQVNQINPPNQAPAQPEATDQGTLPGVPRPVCGVPHGQRCTKPQLLTQVVITVPEEGEQIEFNSYNKDDILCPKPPRGSCPPAYAHIRQYPDELSNVGVVVKFNKPNGVYWLDETVKFSLFRWTTTTFRKNSNQCPIALQIHLVASFGVDQNQERYCIHYNLGRSNIAFTSCSPQKIELGNFQLPPAIVEASRRDQAMVTCSFFLEPVLKGCCDVAQPSPDLKFCFSTLQFIPNRSFLETIRTPQSSSVCNELDKTDDTANQQRLEDDAMVLPSNDSLKIAESEVVELVRNLKALQHFCCQTRELTGYSAAKVNLATLAPAAEAPSLCGKTLRGGKRVVTNSQKHNATMERLKKKLQNRKGNKPPAGSECRKQDDSKSLKDYQQCCSDSVTGDTLDKHQITKETKVENQIKFCSSKKQSHHGDVIGEKIDQSSENENKNLRTELHSKKGKRTALQRAKRLFDCPEGTQKENLVSVESGPNVYGNETKILGESCIHSLNIKSKVEIGGIENLKNRIKLDIGGNIIDIDETLMREVLLTQSDGEYVNINITNIQKLADDTDEISNADTVVQNIVDTELYPHTNANVKIENLKETALEYCSSFSNEPNPITEKEKEDCQNESNKSHEDLIELLTDGDVYYTDGDHPNKMLDDGISDVYISAKSSLSRDNSLHGSGSIVSPTTVPVSQSGNETTSIAGVKNKTKLDISGTKHSRKRAQRKAKKASKTFKQRKGRKCTERCESTDNSSAATPSRVWENSSASGSQFDFSRRDCSVSSLSSRISSDCSSHENDVSNSLCAQYCTGNDDRNVEDSRQGDFDELEVNFRDKISVLNGQLKCSSRSTSLGNIDDLKLDFSPLQCPDSDAESNDFKDCNKESNAVYQFYSQEIKDTPTFQSTRKTENFKFESCHNIPNNRDAFDDCRPLDVEPVLNSGHALHDGKVADDSNDLEAFKDDRDLDVLVEGGDLGELSDSVSSGALDDGENLDALDNGGDLNEFSDDTSLDALVDAEDLDALDDGGNLGELNDSKTLNSGSIALNDIGDLNALGIVDRDIKCPHLHIENSVSSPFMPSLCETAKDHQMNDADTNVSQNKINTTVKHVSSREILKNKKQPGVIGGERSKTSRSTRSRKEVPMFTVVNESNGFIPTEPIKNANGYASPEHCNFVNRLKSFYGKDVKSDIFEGMHEMRLKRKKEKLMLLEGARSDGSSISKTERKANFEKALQMDDDNFFDNVMNYVLASQELLMDSEAPTPNPSLPFGNNSEKKKGPMWDAKIGMDMVKQSTGIMSHLEMNKWSCDWELFVTPESSMLSPSVSSTKDLPNASKPSESQDMTIADFMNVRNEIVERIRKIEKHITMVKRNLQDCTRKLNVSHTKVPIKPQKYVEIQRQSIVTNENILTQLKDKKKEACIELQNLHEQQSQPYGHNLDIPVSDFQDKETATSNQKQNVVLTNDDTSTVDLEKIVFDVTSTIMKPLDVSTANRPTVAAKISAGPHTRVHPSFYTRVASNQSEVSISLPTQTALTSPEMPPVGIAQAPIELEKRPDSGIFVDEIKTVNRSTWNLNDSWRKLREKASKERDYGRLTMQNQDNYRSSSMVETFKSDFLRPAKVNMGSHHANPIPPCSFSSQPQVIAKTKVGPPALSNFHQSSNFHSQRAQYHQQQAQLHAQKAGYFSNESRVQSQHSRLRSMQHSQQQNMTHADGLFRPHEANLSQLLSMQSMMPHIGTWQQEQSLIPPQGTWQEDPQNSDPFHKIYLPDGGVAFI